MIGGNCNAKAADRKFQCAGGICRLVRPCPGGRGRRARPEMRHPETRPPPGGAPGEGGHRHHRWGPCERRADVPGWRSNRYRGKSWCGCSSSRTSLARRSPSPSLPGAISPVPRLPSAISRAGQRSARKRGTMRATRNVGRIGAEALRGSMGVSGEPEAVQVPGNAPSRFLRRVRSSVTPTRRATADR